MEEQARQAGARVAALSALRAALAPAPENKPAVSRATRPAWLNWFRHRWLDEHSTALPADLSAQFHPLRLRAEALETEAAALHGLLAEAAQAVQPGRKA